MSAWPPPESPAAPVLACYRHPKVLAPVSCNHCDRPICTDCMVSAPVGWQCPTCLKDAPKVRRMRDFQVGGSSLSGEKPYLTYALLGICVGAFALQKGSDIEARFAVVASGVAQGEWWRVFTNGFLHVGTFHLLFNVLLLFQLGALLEGRLGRPRFLGLFLLSLVGGSIGALLVQEPGRGAVGASGAVFGLMAGWVALSRRGRSPLDSGLAVLLLINLGLTFITPGISIGGHLGGTVAGALGGLVIRVAGERDDVRRVVAATVVLLALTAGLAVSARPLAEWRCTSGGVDRCASFSTSASLGPPSRPSP